MPSLNDEFSRFAREEQKTLIRSMSRESLTRFFPSHTNPERSTLRSNPMDHSMVAAYLPFLHNQLLELSDPDRPLERKAQRAKFETQMHGVGVPKRKNTATSSSLPCRSCYPWPCA